MIILQKRSSREYRRALAMSKPHQVPQQSLVQEQIISDWQIQVITGGQVSTARPGHTPGQKAAPRRTWTISADKPFLFDIS